MMRVSCCISITQNSLSIRYVRKQIIIISCYFIYYSSGGNENEKAANNGDDKVISVDNFVCLSRLCILNF